MSAPFWQEDCPERGVLLHHVHWAQCLPSETHPGTDETHPSDMCCHCGQQPQGSPLVSPLRAPGTTPEPQRITALPEPVNGCSIDHNSLRPALLIGDGGQEWRKCPGCGRGIEPKLAKGEPGGAPWGPGRGWVSPRMQRRWEAIAYRFRELRPMDAGPEVA